MCIGMEVSLYLSVPCSWQFLSRLCWQFLPFPVRGWLRSPEPLAVARLPWRGVPGTPQTEMALVGTRRGGTWQAKGGMSACAAESRGPGPRAVGDPPGVPNTIITPGGCGAGDGRRRLGTALLRTLPKSFFPSWKNELSAFRRISTGACKWQSKILHPW